MKPFSEALSAIRGRARLPTQLGHAELEQRLPAILRRRALVLARVSQAEILDRVDRDVQRLVAGVSSGPGDYANPASVRTGWKELLDSINYLPEAGREGTISDLRTDARLNLVIDTETKLARGYGQWVQQNDPDAILVYPCLELIRTEPRRTPRGFIRRQDQLIEIERNYWQRRWREAGGQLYDDRMIAPVSDPVWEALSRFGVPHPPFDFNSGMGTRRIGRREAERLGVIEPGERVPLQTPEEFPAPFLAQALQSLGLTLADGLLKAS